MLGETARELYRRADVVTSDAPTGSLPPVPADGIWRMDDSSTRDLGTYQEGARVRMVRGGECALAPGDHIAIPQGQRTHEFLVNELEAKLGKTGLTIIMY